MKLVQAMETKDKDVFSEYLNQEYSQIAQAHFTTLETISTFFKNYLVIMSIPVALLTYFFREDFINFKDFTTKFMPLGGILFVAISLVGLAVLIYIMNLRMDAILYARTVNGIRKYFYDNANIDINYKIRMRTLPQSTFLPGYYEFGYFLPVVFAFALFDTAYFYLGLAFFKFSEFILSPPYVIAASSFFVLHFLIYRKLAEHRETGYLKSHIVGVDIDGVLNRHRDHFCKMLKEKTDKDISPDQIKHIPVHEAGLGISKEEEISVFNDPQYWIKMPVADMASENLKKLKREFNFKVFIFTKRDWPHLSEDIKKITKSWLKENGMKYDKLLIEKSTGDNRFTNAIKNNIRLFIEDDVEKAEKLAFICDVIFLLDHPYNRPDRNLPGNILRVTSWDEIYRTIRRLS